MSRKKKVWIFCSLIAVMMVSACDTIKYYQRDPFYRDGSEWDHLRFPLIKPYYAINIWTSNGESGWQIPLEGAFNRDFRGYPSISNVQKISIENSVVMIYALDQPSAPRYKIINWFVLEPEKEIERGFGNEEDFLGYLDEIGIDEPEWLNPDDVSLQFDETRCLDWIPGCEESE